MRELFRRLGSALSEIRRRRIFHVVLFYAVIAWLVVQIGAVAVQAELLPTWTLALVFFLALLGLPIAAVLAWAYDLTPEGLERTGRVEPDSGTLPSDPTDPADTLRRLGGQGRGEPGEPAAALSSDPGAVPAARVVMVAFVVLVTVGLGWAGWELWVRPAPVEVRANETPAAEAGTETPAEALDPMRVAVLYFDDYSEANDLQPLANGLTEALIHELTQVSALDVVSRYGVKPFRDNPSGMGDPARVLRAGSIVEGSIQRSGDRLRLTVQLVDGATNSHLESATLERPAGDIFDLLDDLVVQVSDLLRRSLGAEIRLRERQRATESAEAWELVQRAEALRNDADRLAARSDEAGARRAFNRADSLLVRAERLDPAWSEPILGRARVAGDRAKLGAVTVDAWDAEWLGRAIQEADRALALRPGDPRALALRGRLHLWRFLALDASADGVHAEAAESDLQAAVEADPSLARAWADLGEVLRRTGRYAEANMAARRALEEDHFLEDAHVVIWRLYQISLNLDDREAAIRWCDEGRHRFPHLDYFVACSLSHIAFPGGPEPDVDRAWRLHDSYLAMSEERFRERNRVVSGLFVAAVLARAAEADRTDGRRERGRPAALADSARAVAAAARRNVPDGFEPWADYYEANVRLLLGEPDAALTLLERHLDALPQQRSSVADTWLFNDLHGDPRFQALVDPRPGD